MPKTSNLMNQHFLKEELEEIKMKLLMSQYAELEGERLYKENEALSQDPSYLPSEQTKQKFVTKVNHYFMLLSLKKALGMLLPAGYKKVSVALAVFIVLLISAVFSVEAMRVNVMNMFVQVKKEFTEIRFGDHDRHLQIAWNNGYVPMKIPAGYDIVNVTDKSTFKMIQYENNDGGFILFQQNGVNSGMNVDTEDADEVSTVKIHELEGIAVRKEDTVTVIWQDDIQLFMIIAKSTMLSLDELIAMAESVALIE